MSEPTQRPSAAQWSKAKPFYIPPPSYWPALTALGITVAAMGLVMFWPVIAMGLLVMVVGLIGWIGALTRHG